MFLKPFVFTLLVLTWAKIAYLSFEIVNVTVFFLRLTINNILAAVKSEGVVPNIQEILSQIPGGSS